jgi:hypothetical protein
MLHVWRVLVIVLSLFRLDSELDELGDILSSWHDIEAWQADEGRLACPRRYSTSGFTIIM